MLAMVYDNRFHALGSARQKSKGAEGAKAGFQRIVETIRAALKDAKIAPSQLAGIGIAVPGPVNPAKGVVVEMPNLGWHNFRLREMLSGVFRCRVSVLNDVDAGTYGEYRFGAGKGGHCVLGVFPGTGIGGGCVYKGDLLQGATRSCMEIGHIRIQPDGPRCGCGGRGCLEALASRLAISAAASAAAYRGSAPTLLKETGTSLKDVRSGALATSIKAGDTAIVALVHDASRWLGIAIGSVVNLLNPDIVVLGGGLVTALPNVFLKGVREACDETVMKSFRKTYKIAVATLGDEATCQGAAAWAMKAGVSG